MEEQDQHQEVEQWLVVEEKCQAVAEHVVCRDNHHVQVEVVDTVKVEEQDQHQEEEWLVVGEQWEEDFKVVVV